MAQAGLSFANPFMEKTSVGEPANPYAPLNPMSSIGMGGLGPSLTDMAVMGEQLVKQSQFTMPDMARPPRGADIAFSPSRKEVFVNGLTFSVDDAQTALQSESYLRGPGTGLPKGGDWVPLDEAAYAQYLDSIRNPSLGRLASKNFGRGVDVMQSLAGRALQLAGAEGLGGRIVAQQQEDLRRTAPFERQFTDIESGRGAVEWLVANFAQQGPNLIESVATAGLGFLAGTASGGPIAGVAATFAGLLGKSAWKESVKAALKKQATGEALNAAESKLIREAAGIAGAVAASYGQNLATGAADIYGELRDQGADVADTDARLKALAGSVPYALLETLPEYLLAGRIFGGMGAPRALPAGASLRQRAGELLRRGAVGGVVGGTAEGATEAGQEALLLGISGQDLSSPEAVNRLINSFAAGFGVGGPIGAVANLKGKEPANLLNPAQNPDEPTPGTGLVPVQPTPPAPGGAPTGFAEPMPPAPGAPAALPGPAPVAPQLGAPVTALPAQNAIMVTGQGELPTGPGTQGVLNIFGPEGVSAQEMAARMQPPAAPVPEAFSTASTIASQWDRSNRSSRNQEWMAGAAESNPAFNAVEQEGASVPAHGMAKVSTLGQALKDLVSMLNGGIDSSRTLYYDSLTNPSPAAGAATGTSGGVAYRDGPFIITFREGLNGRQPTSADITGVLVNPANAELVAPLQQMFPNLVIRDYNGVYDVITTSRTKTTATASMAQPGQMALQFAPPAPGAQAVFNPQMANQMQAIQARIQRQREFEAAQAQLAAQRQAQMNQIAQQSQNARDLFILQQQQAAAAVQPTPQVPPRIPAPPSAPVQLPLFTPKQAPKPSRGEGLRKGGRAAAIQEPAGAVTPRVDLRRSPQIPLFTQEGQPSIAALRAAGVKGKLPVPTLEKGAKQAPPTGKAVTPKTVADRMATIKAAAERLKAKGKQNATQEGKLKQGRVGQREEDNGRVQGRGQVGQQPKTEVQKGGAETGGRGITLKRGAKQETLTEKLTARISKGAFGGPTGALKGVTPPKKAVAAAAAVEVEALPPAEAWEDMKPEGAPAYAALSRAAQQEWAGAEARTMALAEKLAAGETTIEEREPTPAEILAEEIQAAEEATDIRTFRDAIQTVMEYAFFTNEETNTKKLVAQAQAFLDNTQFSEAQRGAMDQAFMEAAQYRPTLEATYTRGSKKDQPKPWFSYALARNLLPSIKAKLINLPAIYKTSTSAVSGKVATNKTAGTTANLITAEPQEMLSELINDLVSKVREVTRLDQEIKFKGKTYQNVVELAKDLYAKVSEKGKNFIVRGYKLSEYFNEDGTPKTLKSGGRFIITNKSLTKEQQRAIEKEQKAEAKALAEAERKRLREEGFQVEDDWDKPEGRFYRDDGSPVDTTIPAGRVKILVNSFLSKLRMKPTVGVYANVEDLRRRNPKLYERAAAARENGDFGTVNAAGYSFGPNVLIFTDFIRTEQQLKFILAHETLGHFGFRGIMPASQLDKVLNRIYDVDPDVRAGVDNMMATRGIPKSEAIEEYLADNAADLDTSVVARIWNAVKNFLNKLGFEFRDDEARYLINQARKYVRRGDTGNYANARTIVSDMEQLDADRDDGRYATAPVGDLASRAFASGALNRRYGNTGGLAGAMEAFYKNIFGARRDLPGKVASILEQVQTLDNKARRSYGLNQIYRMLEKQQQFARSLLSKYQRMTQFTHSPDVFGFGKGVTEEEKERAGELLARAALLRAQAATDELIKSYPSLVSVDAMGNITVDPFVRQELEKAGFVTAEEFRKGFDITYSNGEKVRFQFDVDENSPEWKVYLETRETVNEAAIDLMLSNYEAAQAEGKRVIGDLNRDRRTTNVFTNDDLEAIRKAAELYKNKRYEGSSVASAGVEVRKQAAKSSEDFLVAFGRALFNDDVYKVWTKDPTASPEIAKDFEEFLKAEYDDIRAALPSLRAKVRSDQDSFAVQKAIRDLFLFDLQSKNADYYAKRTILGSYVPFTRRGTEQVRLVAVDAQGNTVKLDENVRATLPYFQVDGRAEAEGIAADLEKQFGDQEFTMLDDTGAEVKVRLVTEVSKTRQSPDLTEAVNFNEFIYVLNRLNANISPDVREKIITTLTNQNSRARRNLQRSGTEGWDKDVVRSVSEHLETSAHVAAKKLYRHRLDDILLDNRNWLGDDQKLRDLKAAADSAATDGERARAKRAYDEYAYMYRYMAGSTGKRTVEIDGEQVPTLGRGEDYREEAKQVLRWYSEATNITDSTEDMLSGEAGSALKLATVLMQLGGSVATAVINLASLATHSLPYLSYYNSARGFGGGYGESKVAAALFRAARDVKNRNLSEAAYLNDIVEGRIDPAQFNLTADEAEFLFRQTEEGTLQAAQFNALVGTARGKVFNNKAQAAIKLWMEMFSYTEQFNRRVTALAAYRLEKERALAQGLSEDRAINAATEAARVAVNTAQGEYAMFNRPEMARGNVLQYVFMYKQFVIVTVQLMRSLPVKGQLMMLGFLLLSSGLKGLPFAEDIFDIVDTIAQKLGLKMASVEKEITEWIDSVAPGMTPFLMRGVLDRVTGATMSTRLGMGDLVPLTGAFRAGADPAREVSDFAGPVFSGISGLVGMAGSLARYGAEVVGLRDDLTTINGILRDSPIAALRAMGDSYAYLNSGMITNTQGQVVSKEAPYHVIFARLMGFYPAIASEQNDIVRLSKHVADYAKAIKAEYVSAYVKATLEGDRERANQVASAVRDWNEGAEGTGLTIRTFEKDAARAAIDAGRPTAIRYLRSAPKQMRPETIELLQAYGLYDEIR